MTRVPALRHSPRVLRDQRLGRVEIQVEVRCVLDVEIEILVLDLVASEIVLCSPATRESDHERTQHREKRSGAGSETGHRSVPRSGTATEDHLNAASLAAPTTRKGQSWCPARYIT